MATHRSIFNTSILAPSVVLAGLLIAPPALAQCPSSFAAGVTFATGGSTSVAVGDLNGDGVNDLAAASGSSNVVVLLGNGNGTFAAAVGYAAGTFAQGVAIGDLNRDGRVDLAVANRGSNNVSVLLGTGNAHPNMFAAAVNYGAGVNTRSVAVADFNTDGWPDLVTANAANSNVSVLISAAGVGFQSAVNFGAGNFPWTVATGDLNADGLPDIAVANAFDNDLSVLLGTGGGNFAPKVDYSTSPGSAPRSVAIGDVNGDGRLDLATANSGNNTVAVLFGIGNGTFTDALINGLGGGVSEPYSVAIADMNGDDRSDLVLSNAGANNVTVLTGSANGTFPNVTNYAANAGAPQSLAVANLNADGRLDIVVAGVTTGNVAVLLHTGTHAAFTQQPVAQSVAEGDNVLLTASTTAATTFQWRRDGVPLVNGTRISGVQSATLTITDALPIDAGVYQVEIGSACGSKTLSAGALLQVGGAEASCQGDIDGDGQIGLTDLALLLTVFGSACP